ncbi:hypothetical protein SSX86_031312 [Deinandra increscens subsp. villosa]|uniref:Leucine-rich repeat-containing N-terminal plant-type domain-containing protein n=1 Tax=Deinandra increscens subsp. villosa TaxID=3103831 RepID=A0AAP0C9U1_9ASTR
MESRCLSKHKPSSLLIIVMMILLFFMVGWIQAGRHIEEEERKALLQIKASLHEISKSLDVYDILPTWVDDGSKYCEWERIKCGPTTSTYVTELSLRNIFSMNEDENFEEYYWDMKPPARKIWPLNASLFLHFEELRSLDLSMSHIGNMFVSTGSQTVSTLKKLQVLDLSSNLFNESLITSLRSLTSLRALYLQENELSGSFPSQELPNLHGLEVLILSNNFFSGTLPMKALTYFHHLEVLDLSYNFFIGSIPSTIKSLSSLKVVSFAYNHLNGSLSDWLCDLKNLHELDLSNNMFDGKLPECLNMLSSLKMFDISSNQFMGILLPSMFANLTSLEYIDFSHNNFEGSFSFSSFLTHKKLEVVAFISDNEKFMVNTEDPIGWTPMFELKVLVLSNCKLNRPKGSVIPSFLLHQHELRKLDLSHNSLQGQFPNWLINNNTMLEVLTLRSNSFDGNFCLGLYRNYKTRMLDMSGNHMNGTISGDIQKFLPNITHLNLSRNSLHGVIPSSFGDLIELEYLDLSHNELSGEIPTGLFKNIPNLKVVKLSNNSFHGAVLSGNLNWGNIERLHLDSNSFTGKIENRMSTFVELSLLDISNNFFTGVVPSWISNMRYSLTFVSRNNSLGGRFPCGTTLFNFLDISENKFSGPIPSCLNFQSLQHLHLGSNRFTGSIPSTFRNLTELLTLDIGNNYLSGRIPIFLGELSKLRILLLGKNNFSGSIPKELCKLTNASLIDLSSNFLSGSIPSCLQNITGPSDQAFMQTTQYIEGYTGSFYTSVLDRMSIMDEEYERIEIQDEVLFTTKSLSLTYKGNMLDIMSGLDLSCNKLTGIIPEELGSLTQIHVLNLSHNRLSGRIPVKFYNLFNIESLDLSSNCLTGTVPSELVNLKSLAIFNVSFNNLSGRLPDMKAQFSTFTKESYEGNPLLCGLPLENECTNESNVTHPLYKDETDDKWYHVDMTSFYGSSGATWFVIILGFAAVVYINPYWRIRWLDLVEECMYTCYYFLLDSSRKLFMLSSS